MIQGYIFIIIFPSFLYNIGRYEKCKKQHTFFYIFPL